ncbi:hypothetical protein [Sphingomonas abaci]|uniref:Uncharacterized protein n=1 Tax=Sphingomonas abaci TaxID=237611 RepID=A0A7W7AM60_9SPHN|nr:hypothetical protein [Sphingomonas abaci]MBB4618660.1 hypothetical protein [Sphingomonas abaci]
MIDPERETHAEGDGGQFNPGENGEDRDIQGKRQEDLTAEDLKGDARETGTE